MNIKKTKVYSSNEDNIDAYSEYLPKDTASSFNRLIGNLNECDFDSEHNVFLIDEKFCNEDLSKHIIGKALDSLQNDGFIIIAAPGTDMSVDSQNPPTDLEVKIKRLNKTNNKANYYLPPPLAEIKEEFIVDNSTAISYEVEAGDFIQVIDLYGRQCSDFQVFDSLKLEKGKELSQVNQSSKIYYHKIGDSQDDDMVIFSDPKNPQISNYPSTTNDGRFLMIYRTKGTYGRSLMVKDLKKDKSEFIKIINEKAYLFHR